MARPISEISPDDPVGGGGDPGDGGEPPAGYVPVGTPIFTLSFAKDDPDSVLRVLAYAAVSSGDDLQFTAFLTIDGTIYQAGRVNVILDNQQSNGAMPITLPAYIGGLSAGTHSIVFSIRNQEPDSALTVLTGSTIEITELKQGAL